jgi:NADH:ubiquinone oxidoreductase subunit H
MFVQMMLQIFMPVYMAIGTTCFLLETLFLGGHGLWLPSAIGIRYKVNRGKAPIFLLAVIGGVLWPATVADIITGAIRNDKAMRRMNKIHAATTEQIWQEIE